MKFVLDVAPDPPAVVGLGAALLLVILAFGAVVAILLVYMLRARRKRLNIIVTENAAQLTNPNQPNQPNH